MHNFGLLANAVQQHTNTLFVYCQMRHGGRSIYLIQIESMLNHLDVVMNDLKMLENFVVKHGLFHLIRGKFINNGQTTCIHFQNASNETERSEKYDTYKRSETAYKKDYLNI